MTLRHAAKPFTAAHVHFALDIVETINPVPEHRHMAPGTRSRQPRPKRTWKVVLPSRR
ncbi:hypothetical protein AQF52_0196 [Streptomyces venezuelae]|nr:hypothetical protein AQF52_0196 [Streptomyces venezuelae]CUM44002.1 hypothetical protein BN2537_16969 [Streptomyces venezuelae]